MRTVYKYTLDRALRSEGYEIEIPDRWEALHVASQQGHICLWTEVDTDSPPCPERFYIIGTGHPLPEIKAGEALIYLGSVLVANDMIVWHVYYRRSVREGDYE